MLWTIFVILLVLWLLGLVTSYTMGGFIHVLLVVAVGRSHHPTDPGAARRLTAIETPVSDGRSEQRPTPAVTAIASAPQNVTRRAPIQTPAPPPRRGAEQRETPATCPTPGE
jgi:hypothetical protein